MNHALNSSPDNFPLLELLRMFDVGFSPVRKPLPGYASLCQLPLPSGGFCQQLFIELTGIKKEMVMDLFWIISLCPWKNVGGFYGPRSCNSPLKSMASAIIGKHVGRIYGSMLNQTQNPSQNLLALPML
jgi:hypothetical protein